MNQSSTRKIPIDTLCIFRWTDRFLSDSRKRLDGQIVRVIALSWGSLSDCYKVSPDSNIQLSAIGAFEDELEPILEW